jgi:hypothetical protein
LAQRRRLILRGKRCFTTGFESTPLIPVSILHHTFFVVNHNRIMPNGILRKTSHGPSVVMDERVFSAVEIAGSW